MVRLRVVSRHDAPCRADAPAGPQHGNIQATSKAGKHVDPGAHPLTVTPLCACAMVAGCDAADKIASRGRHVNVPRTPDSAPLPLDDSTIRFHRYFRGATVVLGTV
jgi:hypothetical protein